MKQSWKVWSCAIVAAIFVCVGAVLPVQAASFNPGFDPASTAVTLVNLDNGESVYQKNADKRLPQASTTKVMTFIIAEEQLKDPANTKVTVTQNALNQIPDSSFVTVQLREGEEMSALNLMYCMLVPSGNDAANVLADYVSNGNISNFVEQMNEKAKELGCTNTHYTNVFGNYDAQHYTSANDLAKIYQYALKLPLFKEITGKAEYTVPATNYSAARNLKTSVKLMDKTSNYYFAECTGGKTGTSDQAGYNLASTAEKDGKNMLCIALGAPSVQNGQAVKTNGAFNDSRKLFDWAFQSLKQQEVLPKDKAVSSLPVLKAKDKNQKVSAVPETAYAALLPADAANGNIQTNVSLPQNVTAPIKKGQKLGTATVSYNGQQLAQVNLVSDTDIAQYIPIYQRPWFRIAVIVVAAVVVVVLIVLLIRFMRRRSRGHFGGRGGRRRRGRYRPSSRRGYHHYH